MMGHKICFNTEMWLIIPKLALLPLLIWSAENYCINLGGCCSCSISRMLKFCIKMLYVMSKVLSDELLCTQTGLVVLLRGHARAPPLTFFQQWLLTMAYVHKKPSPTPHPGVLHFVVMNFCRS